MTFLATLLCTILSGLKAVIGTTAAKVRPREALLSPNAQLFALFERLLGEWRNGTLPCAAAPGTSPKRACPPPSPKSACSTRPAASPQPEPSTTPDSPEYPWLPPPSLGVKVLTPAPTFQNAPGQPRFRMP